MGKLPQQATTVRVRDPFPRHKASAAGVKLLILPKATALLEMRLPVFA